MPQTHLKQWNHNRDFLAQIDPRFPDWAVTVIFYTALHAIDALLKHDKVPRITTHVTRNQVLVEINRYSKIWENFQPLYGLSQTVRYMADPDRWVTWEDIRSQVITRYLLPIEASVRKLGKFDSSLPDMPLVMQEAQAKEA